MMVLSKGRAVAGRVAGRARGWGESSMRFGAGDGKTRNLEKEVGPLLAGGVGTVRLANYKFNGRWCEVAAAVVVVMIVVGGEWDGLLDAVGRDWNPLTKAKPAIRNDGCRTGLCFWNSEGSFPEGQRQCATVTGRDRIPT